MKRSLAVVLALALVLSLCAGMSVFATQAEPAPAQSITPAEPAPAQNITPAEPAPTQNITPTEPAPAQGTTPAEPAPTYDITTANPRFYANGIPIEITDDGEGGVIITWKTGSLKVTAAQKAEGLIVYGGGADASYDGGTDTDYETSSVTLNSGKICQIYGGGRNQNVAQTHVIVNDGEVTNVFGGNQNTADNVTATNIEIHAGTISSIYGGGRSSSTTVIAAATTSNITISGGKIETVCGGGYANSHTGTTNVTVNGPAEIVFVMGGGFGQGNGNNCENTKVTNANIDISDGKIAWAYGGGQGYNTTNSVTINISGAAAVDNIFGSGSNGRTSEAEINISGGVVPAVSAVVRGTLENSEINISGGKVTNAYVGSDAIISSAGDTNSGNVSDSATLNITSATAVDNAYLGGGLNGPLDAAQPGIIDEAADSITINSLVPVSVAKNSAAPDNSLGAATTLALKNTSGAEGTTLKIPTGGTLTNLGTIIIESNSTLSIPEDAELVNDAVISTSSSTASIASVASTAPAAAVSGVIENRGALSNAGRLTNKGVVKVLVTGSLANEGALTNDGTLENGGAITIESGGSITNGLTGTLANNGAITNSGAVENNGTLENGGSITNSGTIAGTKPICATDDGSLTNNNASANVTERKILERVGANRTKGAARNMVIRANDDDNKFFDAAEAEGSDNRQTNTDILINGVSVIAATDDCSVTKGSVVVTLKKDYLDSLANGSHTLRIVYSDGSYTQTSFTISPAAAAPPSASSASHPNPSTDFSLWDWLAGLFS